MSNALIFGGMAIVSLFVFMNLGKIKASKNQTGRENRINRFKKDGQGNIKDRYEQEEKNRMGGNRLDGDR